MIDKDLEELLRSSFNLDFDKLSIEELKILEQLEQYIYQYMIDLKIIPIFPAGALTDFEKKHNVRNRT